MTVGVLLDRIDGLIDAGTVSRDTPVCLYSDEFMTLWQADAGCALTADPSEFAEELERRLARAQTGHPTDEFVADTEAKIAELRAMGKAVLCVGGA